MPHVIVVGGGIIGASIAWHLAQQDATVTVVAAEPGGTATPNSFAWLNANFGNPRYYYDLRRRSLAHWHVLADTVPGLRPLVQWTGSVQWEEIPNHVGAGDDLDTVSDADEAAGNVHLARLAARHVRWGYDVRRVDAAAIAAREPWLADDALPATGWGLVLAEEGAVEPAEAARVFLQDAAAHGATVRTDTVEALLVQDHVVVGVQTLSGPLYADHVVLAAGLGAVPLCAAAGITLPVHSRAGLLVHSKPVAPRLLHGLVISNGPHVRQTAAGRLVAGASFAGTDPGNDPQAAADALFARTVALFRPALDGTPCPPLELERYTVGQRPDPADGLPIVGPSGLPGLTLAVMHSGVTMAALVGQSVAAAVVQGQTDPAWAPFKLDRFVSK